MIVFMSMTCYVHILECLALGMAHNHSVLSCVHGPLNFCAWRYALLVGFLFLALCMSPTFSVRGSVHGFDVSVLGSVHGSKAPCDAPCKWLADFLCPTLFIDSHALFAWL